LITNFTLSIAKVPISNSQLLLDDLGAKGEVISYPVRANSQKRLIKKSQLLIATAGRNVEKKGFFILQKEIPGIEIISNLPINKFRQKLLEVDIFICYSIRDSKGNLDDSSVVAVEAMAAGCVVMTTNLPGYKAIINDGQNGFLVNDPADLKRKIDLVKKNPELRKEIAKNARKTVKKNFTPEFIARKYLQLMVFLKNPD